MLSEFEVYNSSRFKAPQHVVAIEYAFCNVEACPSVERLEVGTNGRDRPYVFEFCFRL